MRKQRRASLRFCTGWARRGSPPKADPERAGPGPGCRHVRDEAVDISWPLNQFGWVIGKLPPIRTRRRLWATLAGTLCSLALGWSGCAFERTGLGPAVGGPSVNRDSGASPPSSPGPSPADARSDVETMTPPPVVTTPRADAGSDLPPDASPLPPDAGVSVPPEPPPSCPVGDDLTLCLNFEQAIADGSLRRTPVIGRDVDFAAGPSGRAARFAEGSSIEVTSDDLFGPSGGTIELWVNPAAVGRRMGLVDGPYRLTLLASGSAMCVASGGYALFSDAVRAGTWTSLACTFDAGGLALWVDGQKVRETSTPLERRVGSNGDRKGGGGAPGVQRSPRQSAYLADGPDGGGAMCRRLQVSAARALTWGPGGADLLTLRSRRNDVWAPARFQAGRLRSDPRAG